MAKIIDEETIQKAKYAVCTIVSLFQSLEKNDSFLNVDTHSIKTEENDQS